MNLVDFLLILAIVLVLVTIIIHKKHNLYAINYHSISSATLKINSNGRSFHTRHRKEQLQKKQKNARKKKLKLYKGSRQH